MYSKLTFFVVSAFTLSALAAPQDPAAAGGAPPPPPPPTVSQCNGGTINCCNSVQNANSNVVQSLLGTLGAAAGSVTGQVGLGCTPISVIGVGGNSCTQQAACCTGNTISGGITLACSPINVNL